MKGKIHRVMDDGSIPADKPVSKHARRPPHDLVQRQSQSAGPDLRPANRHSLGNRARPARGDELNIIRKGLNYGWPTITYGINYSGTPITDHTSQDGMEQPITYWTPSLGASGLTVYHGDKFPQWEGNIFAGALALTKIVRVKLDGQKVAEQEDILKGTGRIRDLRVFDDGLSLRRLRQSRQSRPSRPGKLSLGPCPDCKFFRDSLNNSPPPPVYENSLTRWHRCCRSRPYRHLLLRRYRIRQPVAVLGLLQSHPSNYIGSPEWLAGPTLLGDWWGIRNWLDDNGIEFSGSYTNNIAAM